VLDAGSLSSRWLVKLPAQAGETSSGSLLTQLPEATLQLRANVKRQSHSAVAQLRFEL
jgi:hypothetical protein